MPHFPAGTGMAEDTKEDATSDSRPTPFPDSVQTTPDAIRVKNRRKRYLDTHPDYFSASLELADPLLYDRLIRRFQTPQEREAEGRKKGYSGILEADLWRSEAKIEALANPDRNAVTFSYRRGEDGEILAEEEGEVPVDKEEGRERWVWEMTVRFLKGGDGDFDYGVVDGGEEFDDVGVEEREAEEKWFDGEEPMWVGQGEEEEKARGKDGGGGLRGETGVQDF